MKYGSFLIALLLLTAAPVSADTIYRWTDDKGVTQYTAHPPGTGSSPKSIPAVAAAYRRVPLARALPPPQRQSLRRRKPKRNTPAMKNLARWPDKTCRRSKRADASG